MSVRLLRPSVRLLRPSVRLLRPSVRLLRLSVRLLRLSVRLLRPSVRLLIRPFHHPFGIGDNIIDSILIITLITKNVFIIIVLP